MKRVLLVFLIVSLLCSNLGSAFAALPTEGDVKEEITSAEAVSQPYPNFKEGKETGDVIAQLLSDVSVADSVYSNKPRGKFIIRISSNHIVRDPTNALRHSTNNKFNDSSDVSENISESDLAYKLDYFKVNTFEALNSISMELNTDEANYLLTNSLIESIEEDKLIEIAAGPLTTVAPQNIKDTSQTIPWGIHSTGAYIAQNQDLNGSLPIKIAVFDTGISSHPDLNLSGGISFVENDPTYNDNQGHGTHIAGTITASNNSFGVIGIVPDAELYSVKVMESDGIGYTSSVLSGIQWAIDNNINIINMSFVSSQYSEALHAAIRLATQSGIMIVAAAGNKGAGEDTVQYPAKYPEVVAVGAVDASHHKADFSSTGSDLDLVAPGFGIVSTMANGTYGVASGTSNAAAHVTGAAALVWSYNRSLSSNAVEQLLKDTATPLGAPFEYGNGLINIAKALNIINGPIAPLSEENLSGLNTHFPTKDDGDLSIASYDKVNDGATVIAGSSITVSLKLEGDRLGNNPHSEIIIEVYSPLNPSNILASAVVNNPQLNVAIPFTWNTSPSTPTGTYHIKYRYPALASSNFDDIFVIYVTQPGAGPDTYEPNDTFVTAKVVTPGNSYISYISSSSDKDYYKFSANNSGSIQISLMVPSGVDYDLSILDASGGYIGQSSSGTGISENLNANVVAGQTYYIEVLGFSGAFSTTPYTLVLGNIELQPFQAPSGLETVSYSSSIKLSWDPTDGAISYKLQLNGAFIADTTETTYTFTNLNASTGYRLGVAAVYPEGISNYSDVQAATSIPQLIVYQPEDIDSTIGSYQLFTFKPATTGVFRIYTSPYGGTGAPADTTLGIYSNQQLNKLIAENDDANDTVFSEIEVSLVAGQTYYVKVSGFDSTRLRARITAEVVSSNLPYIQLNQPVDINQQAGNSNVYVFVPAANGQYRITTSPFNGNTASKRNDTHLSVFSNLDMEDTITNGYNDDKGDSVYSEVVVNLTAGNPYYFRVTAASGSKVYARLLVTAAGGTEFTALQQGVPIDLSRPSGEDAYFKFTPAASGVYRFFSANVQGNPQLNDTEISVYADSGLKNLLDANDDVKGYKPYGELFSKLEMYLNAGTTYYVVASSSSPNGLQAQISVENTQQSSPSTARTIAWGDSLETDVSGQPLRITSLYDVDYYKIQLNTAEQVSLYLSDGEGTIEDSNGNIKGYFSKEGKMNFDLTPGTYYLKVEHTAIHDSARTLSWKFKAYDYELTAHINEIEYMPGTYGETSILRMLNSGDIKVFDATPGANGKVTVGYNNKKASTRLHVEVFTSNGISIRKFETSGGGANTSIPVSWDGKVDSDLVNKNLFASSATIYYVGTQYWAKSGVYDIVVFRLDGNKRKDGQSFRVKVFNDPLNSLNLIPIPPSTFGNNKTITASDIDRCQECRNYYFRYIYSTTEHPVPETAYVAWFQGMYGLTKLAKFWKGAEELFLCPSDDLGEGLQCTLDTIGMIPILGEGADAINGVIYLVKGEYANALLSAGAIIPFAGAGFIGAKKFNKIFKYNPCGCLPAGTLIKTSDGEKPIEDIQVGDLVLAKNTETGAQAYKPVEQLYSFDAEVFYVLQVDGKEIRTTSNHPFWVKDKGWIAADELVVGDQLETENLEYHTIDFIDIEYNPSQVYNFTVDGYHTYYISEQGYLTHNLVDACRLDKYAAVSPVLKTGKKGTPSEILEAEIKWATGIDKPSGWRAHHIVAEKHPNEFADKARGILRTYGIDKNSSANGVHLPTDTGKIFTSIDGQTLATHNGGHSGDYFEYVYQVLKAGEEAEGKDGVLKALNHIRSELLTGKLAIGKI